MRTTAEKLFSEIGLLPGILTLINHIQRRRTKDSPGLWIVFTLSLLLLSQLKTLRQTFNELTNLTINFKNKCPIEFFKLSLI